MTSKKATGTLTVGNIIKVASVRFRDKEAIYCALTGRRFTYGEVNRRTNSLANGLLGLGAKKGQVCAFLMYNRAEIVETYFALAKIGVLGIPLNYRLAPGEMTELMNFCDAEYLIFEPAFAEVVAGIRGDLTKVKTLLCTGEDVPDFALSYEELLSKSDDAEPDAEVNEEDYQYLNLTSGTTGLPKAYLLTQYNNVTAGPPMAMAHDLTEDDVVLTVFPVFGRVGFAWSAMSMMVGARNVLCQIGQTSMLQLIQDEKATVSNWVPTIASIVFSLPNYTDYDLSSLRGLVFAAAPFPQSLQERVKREICPNIYEFYGLQESGILTQIKPRDKDRKPGSVGLPHLGADVRVVDAQGKDCPPEEIGEIIGRGSAVTTGYFKNEEKTREMFKDGWFHTGDLGYFDDEGFLFLSGRMKDMIISGGQNVFAAEVEDVMMSHEAVLDCAVIGLPDEKWGEAVTAVVIKDPNTDVTEEDLIEYARNKIAHFKAPKRIIFADTIPTTPTGKVTKYVLVEKYAKEE